MPSKGNNSLPSDQRMCWFCEFFRYEQAEPGHSEVTPGNDFSIGCQKNHWTFDAYDDSQKKFGECLSKAKTCKDYIQIKT
jgi:hypothetical protein